MDDLNYIQMYKPRFCHIKGENNQVADFFSRAINQISNRGPEEQIKLGLAGARLVDPVTHGISPFYSEFLERIKVLIFDEANDDLYQGKLIREIALSEDTNSSFRLIDGLIYLCPTASDSRLYIPPGTAQLNGNSVDIRTALIALAHQMHEGITRTTNNLRNYYWPRMSQQINAYIRSCIHCQKKNVSSNLGRITGRSIPDRFQRIIIDHATPNTIGTNPYGISFKHVLIICDSFSRYIQLIPVHTTETTETIEHLIKWSLVYGFPREIVADNAASLRSKLIEKVLSITTRTDPSIHRWIAPVAYPQSQGEAERVVRELKSYVNVRNDSSWPQTCSFLSFAHNSSNYGASQLSPYTIVFGKKPESLIDMLSWPQNEELPSSAEEYLSRLQSHLNDYHDLYRMKMEEYRTQSRDYYNSNHPMVEFKEGDKVWVVHKTGFRTDVDGPGKIIEKVGDHMYNVEVLNETRLLPMQHLVPFVETNLIDRSGIPFADSVEGDGINRGLHRKDLRSLKRGDLLLVKRGRNSDDIFEYDVGRIIDNSIDAERFRVDLMTVSENNYQWVPTGLIFDFPYSSVLASGFTLTRNKQLRRSTIAQWQRFGIQI